MSAALPDSGFPPATNENIKSTGGEDVGLPLMQDSRFERDTLFLVFEEDFRFEPDDVGRETTVKFERVGGEDDGAEEDQSAAWPD